MKNDNSEKVKLRLEKSVNGNGKFFDVTVSQTNDGGDIEISETIRYPDIVAATRYISLRYGKTLPETINLTQNEEAYVRQNLNDRSGSFDVV